MADDGVGYYKSDEFPLLGLVTAVCCGNRSERERFSRSVDYYAYCVARYGVSDTQARVMTAAAHNPAAEDQLCVPTHEQLVAIVDAMVLELTDAVPSPVVQAYKLDPHLTHLFPTLDNLYAYYVIGTGAAPDANWRVPLLAEFDQFGTFIW